MNYKNLWPDYKHDGVNREVKKWCYNKPDVLSQYEVYEDGNKHRNISIVSKCSVIGPRPSIIVSSC